MPPNLVRSNSLLAIAILIALVALLQSACNPAVVVSGPQSGVVGKWRNADGSYSVEFLPTGNCSAKMRIQGREVGGPCTYTVDDENIVLHYKGFSTDAQQSGPNASATWRYTLEGDTLTVAVMGNSMVLKRVR